MTNERRFLGRDTESNLLLFLTVFLLGPLVLLFAARRKVYLVEGAVEVDEDMNYEIERRRVYFDDVLAITYHRVFGTLFITVMVFCALVLGAIALALWSERAVVGALAFLFPAALCLAGAVFRLVRGVDVITIYGRRTRARITFGWAKAGARRTFEELARLIRARQAEARPSIPSSAPVPGPPVPPPSGGAVGDAQPPAAPAS